MDLMEFFDESDLAQRQQIVSQARVLLDDVVSIAELGARRHDLQKRVKLSKPGGRERRSRGKTSPEVSAPDVDGSDPIEQAPDPNQSDVAGSDLAEESVEQSMDPVQGDVSEIAAENGEEAPVAEV